MVSTQRCSNPRVGDASSWREGHPEVSTQQLVRFPRDLNASDLINQVCYEVEGVTRTLVGLYRLQEACRDLQGVGTFCAVPTPIEPSSGLYDASWSLVEALEGSEERGWSALLLCTECKPSGCR